MHSSNVSSSADAVSLGTTAGTRVLVLGHGREGSSVARFLSESGAIVTIADKNQTPGTASCWIGGSVVPENQSSLREAQLVVLSPGIPDSNPVLLAAIDQGLPITTPTQFFFSLCPCPIVGVTGSNGKSTTTALIASILQPARESVELGGNVGKPMLDLLTKLTKESMAVIELSSFQLQRLDQSPNIAVVTNVTPNHLDRHGSFTAYLHAKTNIVSHQASDDLAVLNSSDPNTRSLALKTQGTTRWFGERYTSYPCAGITHEWVVYDDGSVSRRVLPVEDIPLRGKHNIDNVLAAVAATAHLVSDTDCVAEAVRKFRGLPHRLEPVAELNHVRYVDDSIATSPERAAVGLRSIDTPVVLLAGGRSKHLSWQPVVEAASEKVHTLVVFGEAAEEVESAFSHFGQRYPLRVRRTDSMEEAVQIARKYARSGDTVLLSPGCTSFDMFKDFEERGCIFASIVRG